MSTVKIDLDNEKKTVMLTVEGKLPDAEAYNMLLCQIAFGLTKLTGESWKIVMPEDGQYLSA
jgi:hypothetical protein